MVKDLIKSISQYEASRLYKNLRFDAKKSVKYSSVRESVATTMTYSIHGHISYILGANSKRAIRKKNN